MKTTIRFWLIVSIVWLCSCSPAGPVTRTKINIEFPFEPGFPGYIVDISSQGYTANLMCSLPQEGGPGEVLDIDAKVGAKPLGVCDTKSMTLDFGINEKIKATIILGGFPFIHDVAQAPNRIVDISNAQTCPNCRQAEFDFKAAFPK